MRVERPASKGIQVGDVYLDILGNEYTVRPTEEGDTLTMELTRAAVKTGVFRAEVGTKIHYEAGDTLGLFRKK